MKIKIRKAKEKDIFQISKIASENFSGLKNKKDSIKWISCNFKAYPRMIYFVAEINKEIVAYNLWIEKGGFRKDSVWELEQIATSKIFQGKGVGSLLISTSFCYIKKYLKKRKSKLKLVEITTGVDNKAQKLYKKYLKAKKEARIKDLFKGDEIIMIRRE